MNVDVVQRRLWEQSQQHREHRESDTPLFPVNKYEKRSRGLMDLMHQPQWIAAACDRVLKRSRGKAAGVDGVTAADFEKKRRTELETLRQELKRGTYQPQPLRRVMIPKANGKMRPLGIPCLRDKIVQEAIRMALEPIFEAEFHDSSYGFRPNRSTHHAVFRCRQMMHRGFTWVIEGDVKACFDEISHQAILSCLREKVMDNKFLDLIGRLLKAGVNIDGVVHPTEKGVPQGGVASPLLANVVLNKLDWFLHGQGQHGDVAAERSRLNGRPNVRFVRYADDWCVFITRGSKRYAEKLRDQIQSLLHRECGVELSLEKTHITHVRDGFDFLGFHLELGIGRDGKHVPKIKVPRKAVTEAVKSLNAAIRHRPHQESAASRIVRGSAVVWGWSNYYKIGHNFSKVAGLLDHHAFWIAVKAFCRKFDLSTAQCLAKYAQGGTISVGAGRTLQRASDIKMSLDFRNPEPYTPGTVTYLDDLDWEADFRMYESGRLGSMDFKVLALHRDGFRCRKCGTAVTWETSEADHIQPVSSFASFTQAHTLKNVQTLCLVCHKEKTRA